MSDPVPSSVLDSASPSSTPPRTPTPAGGTASTLRDLTRGTSGALALLVLVFVCYARVSQADYIWDDDAYVTANTTLRSFAGLSRIWTEIGATPQYYPMTFTSFWLEVRAFGFSPGVSHVINFVLHAAGVLLLWKILQRLAVPGAWAAAAVFAVHPICVESVAWISERKNTLSLVFALSAAWTYLRYAGLGTATDAAGEPKPAGEGFSVPLPSEPKRLYRLFLALFVLGLLSKTTVSVLPAVLLVIVWWQRGRITRRDVLPLLPAFALGLIGGLVTAYLEQSPYYVGASGPDWQVGIVGRVMLVGQTAAFYAWKTLWPFPFGVTHDSKGELVPLWVYGPSFNYYKWALNPTSVLQWLPLAGVIGTVAALWALRHRVGRGPLASVLVFLIGLAPASGLFVVFPMRFSWVADHFAYVGCIGLIVGVVAGVTRLLRSNESASAGVAVAALAACAWMTITHAQAFTSVHQLWKRTWATNNQSWLAAVNLGTLYLDQADPTYAAALRAGADDALQQRDKLRDASDQWLHKGLELRPDSYEAYTQLGRLAVKRNDPKAAVADFRTAVDMAQKQQAPGGQLLPTFLLGETLAAQGDTAGALAAFDSMEPLEGKLKTRFGKPFAQMHTSRGVLLLRGLGKPAGEASGDADMAVVADAIDHFVKATELAPEYPQAKLQLASLLGDIGKPKEALEQLNDVLVLDPRNADAQLMTARIAVKQGRPDVAVVQLQKLVAQDPRVLTPHLELAKAHRAAGSVADAVTELKATIEALPNATAAKQLLAEMEAAATQPSATQAAATQATTRP